MHRIPPRRNSRWFYGLAHYGTLVLAVGLAFAAGLLAEGPTASPATRPAEVYTAWPFDANEAARRQNETARAMGIKKEVTIDVGGVGMRLILIPAGKFMMGIDGNVRETTLAKPYYLGMYKVTQGQYVPIMGKNPSDAHNPSFPMDMVTWQDAEEFCQKASKKTGKKIYLPAEDQWENACRAGANTKFFWGDDETKLGEYAWYRENMGGQARAVGLKKPNAWGLYDINGLLWEYCRKGNLDANVSEADAAAGVHVCRGATWGSRPPMFVLGVTTSTPAGGPTDKASMNRFGFRVAMDAA